MLFTICFVLRNFRILRPYQITILTDDRYVNPIKKNAYEANILLEDGLLQKSLENQGLSVIRKSWSDRAFDWTTTEFALFRTTWDYFDRFDEFIRWMGRTSKLTKFINPFKLVQWNLDKHYLLDLSNSGIPIVPSRFIKPSSKTSLKQVVEQSGWTGEFILKPAISGAGRHTYRFDYKGIAELESTFRELIHHESMMLQPFMKNVLTKGEISLIVISGKVTHGILKKAKQGDFRVQDDFGGSVESYQPTSKEIELAEKSVAACPFLPLYARVDIIWDDLGNEKISELELIEPELFFRLHPAAADLLAATIIDYIKNHQH